LTPLSEQGAKKIRAVFRAGINYFRELIPATAAPDAFVMAGHSPLKTGVNALMPGHPRLACLQ
jgi:hypothetical protein